MPDDTGSGDHAETNDNDGGRDGAGAASNDEGKGGKEQILADLARERDLRQAAAKEAKRLEAELNKLRESSMSETEKAIAQAKREAMAEAQTAFNRRLVQAEVRALAAGKLADPEDAVRFLELDQFELDADGNVDKKAIEREIGSLLKAKPYLTGSATRSSGSADQGARGGQSVSSMNDIFRSAARR